MGTTLANTARWQLSSSILHGFIGAYQQAMGYVKDLNASLTDIRIVTGKSIEDMARFAEEANRAAKALSTTTNEYAQASLIFYQQGLNETEVAKRTEVTVKMANAAGQTAQVVSDQLTAVWNNFYDGSKSLEYYADVMTALGAATASSTDEIAGGLEKFAAIADTIGLSYEYAASALATITANTRQSEEVVGTALKTIFARIQGLNLGETLDDGTTLNKYSEALQKVGISIFDQAGELKDMDIILDEMGEKWDTLNKAQQTALAQTVAGVRQYNQLIALMDNWDNGDSDSMQANLMTSYNAEGTLQEQADIYAQSWEAARDRVQASLESIYKDILNDEFFIDIANGFSGLLDSLDAFIDGVGGIKTVIMGIGSFFLASFANKVQPALMNLKHTFSVVFQSAEKQAQNLANEMNKGISETLSSSTGQNFSDSSKTALQNAMTMNSAKAKLQSIEASLNDTEKQRFNLELQMLQADQEAAQAVADKITKRKEEIALLAEAFDYEQSTKSLENSRGKEEQDLIDNKKAAEQAYLNDPSNATKSSLTEATNQLNEHRAATERLVNAREQYAKSLYDAYNTEMQTTQGAIESSTKLLNI
jgi:TP901 family phage tail tape measure protein